MPGVIVPSHVTLDTPNSVMSRANINEPPNAETHPARWGFTDVAQFIRAYEETYGRRPDRQ